MPELPEVQTVVQTLSRHVGGMWIARVHCHRRDIITPAGADLASLLTGRRIQLVSRRGKRIIVRLDTGQWFWIHLGMTGRLTAEPADAPLRPHTHLCLDLVGGPDGTNLDISTPISAVACQVRFCDPRRFGGIFIPTPGQTPDDGMGPEPLEMTADQLAQCMSRTSRPIKSALLDQSIIAGLGNIYADEALFAARIHPLTSACKITPEPIARLCESIQKILRNAITAGGSTLRDFLDADGHRGRFQDLHKVYGHAADPCPTCTKPIRRIVLAGRSTHFCPGCQIQPRRTNARKIRRKST